jgi:site-specific recombinase XerD
VPLNYIVRAALEQLQRTATGDLVFSRADGLPFRSVKTVFRTACKRAGLVGVSPHVLRHTFASRLVMSGVDLKTVMELGGWSSLEMIQRYAHLSASHKAEAIERIGREFTYGIPHSGESALTVAS